MEGLAKLRKLVKKAKKPTEQSPGSVKVTRHINTPSIEEKACQTKEKPVRIQPKKPTERPTPASTLLKPLIKRNIINKDPRNHRTLFVGNAPMSLTKKQVMKLCSKYGKVESIRMRCAAVSPGKLPVKVARKLKKQLTGDTVNWYVVMTTTDEAKQCLELNGIEFEGRHLRVDMATPTTDNHRTVFVGNIPFTADEEKLRDILGHCGEIEGVRIVKDNRSGIGKGIAYVLFKESSGVLFALKHNSKIELEGRKLRITNCKTGNNNNNGGKTNKQQQQQRFTGARARPPKDIKKIKKPRHRDRVKMKQ